MKNKRPNNSLVLGFSLLTSKERWQFLLLGLWIVTIAVLETVSIYSFYFLLTLFSQGQQALESTVGKTLRFFVESLTYRELLASTLGFTALIFVVKNGVLFLQIRYQNHLLTRKAANLKRDLFSRYLAQPFLYHAQKGHLYFHHRAQRATEFVLGFLLAYVNIFAELFVVFGLLLLLLKVNFFATLFVLAISSVVMASFILLIRSKVKRLGEQRLEAGTKADSIMTEALMGIKEVKVLHREDYFLSFFEQFQKSWQKHFCSEKIFETMPRGVIELVFTLILVGLMVVMILLGNLTSILPLMGVYALAAFRFLPSLNRILGQFSIMKSNTTSTEMAYEDYHFLQPFKPRNEKEESFLFGDRIELKNIHFTFPGKKHPALNGVDLTIKCGEVIGIIGKSGSGKTTLMDVLLGVIPPDLGQVLVDAKDITSHLFSWQNQVGYIPQMIYLMDASIKRNIAFQLDDQHIDEARVHQVLEETELAEFIQTLPDGIDTEIGDRGVRLSGGQRQRLGIARALYRQNSVLLLDEATSALDNETEASIMQSLHKIAGKKTIIMIAHRLSTIERCNYVYLIEKGQLEYASSYPEMMKYLAKRKKAPPAYDPKAKPAV